MNRLPLLALPALLIACDGQITLEEYGPEFSDSMCSRIFECCSQEQIDTMTNFLIDFSSEEQCEQGFEDLFMLGDLLWSDAETEGRMRFDPDAAQACLDSYALSTCDELRSADSLSLASSFDTCVSPFEALVEAGGACASELECIGEATCEGGDFFSASGKCMPYPGEGDLCEWYCQTGLYCDWDYDLDISHCVRIPALGESCEGICPDDAYCDYTANPAVCATIPGLGDACTNTCAVGTFCDWNESPSVCVVLPGLAEECAGACAVGGHCDTGQSPAICVPQLAGGSTCEFHSECLSSWCDYDAGLDAYFCDDAYLGCM